MGGPWGQDAETAAERLGAAQRCADDVQNLDLVETKDVPEIGVTGAFVRD